MDVLNAGMKLEDKYPASCALLRLMLFLIGVGVFCVSGVWLVVVLLVHAGAAGIKLSHVLGGSWMAKAGGGVVTFILFAAGQAVAGLSIAWGWVFVTERWPNNPIFKLIEWVKRDEP